MGSPIDRCNRAVARRQVNADALPPLAARLADAVSARRALDIVARAGEAVPAEIARQSEEEIREAELAVIKARAGETIE